MKNVTITLDEETVAWARVEAARRNVSLSRLLGEMLEARMREAGAYEDAMRGFLSRQPIRLSKGQERPCPGREDTHDRARLR